MDAQLAGALANTGLLVGCALALWWYWRREARRFPQAFAPLAPLPDASFPVAELVQERRKAAELLEEAGRQLERVQRAFAGGLRDGRRR
jgi:hypothetical protein